MDYKVEHQKCEPRKYINYALFTSRGLHDVFDFMRYERAFFARKTDVETISASSLPANVLDKFHILLGRYDYRVLGNWSHDRICSDQRLEVLHDLQELWELKADITVTRVNFKVQSTIDFTGTLSQILDMMWLNMATPYREVDARKIEQGFYEEPSQLISVTLLTFMSGNNTWKVTDTH